MMPFIGVRISWLMLARKALLARLAPSAASLARTSSWVRRLTFSSRCSRYCSNASSRLSISTSMVLKASASCPISSLECLVARSLKFLLPAIRLAVSVSDPRAESRERCIRLAISRASAKATSEAAAKAARSVVISCQTLPRLAVRETVPMTLSFMVIGTMLVTCFQSATVPELAASVLRRWVSAGEVEPGSR
ncbi:hypothetical protein SDC9_120279 [bioreactor metagenome]|uniref:Uncharacterized protein n=1 Tax=bioreactor metagenome TaxID=1076179 RepID=A0A645C6M1_9ZZZZ